MITPENYTLLRSVKGEQKYYLYGETVNKLSYDVEIALVKLF